MVPLVALPVTPERREGLVVAGCLAVLHGYLLLRGLPFPDVDMTAYVEPAVVFVKEGVFRAPGSQHLNVLNLIQAFFYPPGYFWALTLWIFAWGASAVSLLAFTHCIYFGFFLLTWHLLRRHFGCGRLASAIAVLSLLATIRHGRPDGVALLGSALVWLWVARRPGLAGLALGGVGLCSPAFGLSTAISSGVFLLLSKKKAGVKPLLLLAGIAAAVFVVVFAGTLAKQGALSSGLEQFKLSLTLVGPFLNRWPDLFDRFGVLFVVLPVFVLTLLPALRMAMVREDSSERRLSLAFFAGFLSWLFLNGGQLLTGLHYVFPARAFVHGRWASARRWGWVPVVLYAGVHFYLAKGTWVYAFRGFDRPTVAFEEAPEYPLALDGPLFPGHYRIDSTLNYEIWKASNWWWQYQRVTSQRALASLPPEKRTPAEPNEVWVTAWTLTVVGEPDPDRFTRVSGKWPIEKLSLFGNPMKLPREPLHLYRYVRTEARR